MPVLWRGDKPLAALGSFIDRQKQALLYFVAGRDESCNDPPPGLVLHAHSIRWAIENGLKTYDFLRGDESFKYSYGATDRHIRYLLIGTRSGANLNHTLDPRCIDDVLKQATRYQRTGRAKWAENGFQQILEIRPQDTTALRRYGRLLYHNKDFVKAKNVYLKLLEIDQKNTEGWRGLGKSLLALNEFQDAEKAIRKAIKLSHTETISTRYYLGRALQGQDMEAAAANECTAVLNLEPRDVWEKKKHRNAQKYIKQCTKS
jgi:tetratricopeptide (TPR) repeat protein